MNNIKVTFTNPSSTVDKLRPIDDTFMQKLGKDRDFCQELIRIVLGNPHIEVVENITQDALHNIDTRSVTIDLKCQDEKGTIFGVEVQKENDDDHQKRVRYNSSCLQVQSLKKGDKFRDLPDVCMIFISERDFLRRGNVIYHIDRVLRETGEVIDNGYQEIYVNAEIDDGSDLAEYMKIFKSNVVCSNTKFPIMCDLTDYYKNGKGRDAMCQAVEEYAKECGELNRREGRLEGRMEGRMEGELKGRILTYTELGFSINDISEKMNLSVDEVQEVLDDAIL